ncbi:MAG TPA: hypothetical protein VK894_03475 [Jiangellales bacterium]|nr:hypothetical protein [Jiangellales bacterium]
MTWCWFAHLPPGQGGGDRAPAHHARAPVWRLDGEPAGELVAWPAGRKPVAAAVRVAAAVVDPAGPEAWASVVLLPRDRSPLFDDPAVSGALRAVLAGPPPDAVSTLVRDASHFAGSVTVRRGDPRRIGDDPFARLGAARVLRVGPGLFGSVPLPAGPVIQRYSGQPWPAAGF